MGCGAGRRLALPPHSLNCATAHKSEREEGMTHPLVFPLLEALLADLLKEQPGAA